MTGFIYLASQSPRRVELLRQVGIAFEPLPPDPDEDTEALETTRPGEAPASYVKRVVLAKLQAARVRLARRGLPPAPLLCADTTVAIGGRLLGKPVDAADATAMLNALAGRSHRVLTAVVVGDAGHTELAIQVSRVSFARLSAARIAAYVAGGEPFGKAGGYAIQGAAAAHIRFLSGSHSAVVGLPLFETAQLLRGLGYKLP